MFSGTWCSSQTNTGGCRYWPASSISSRKKHTATHPSTCRNWWTWWNWWKKRGISLPLVQVSGSDKGVNLMTAHGSKGLEFEYVFLVGCNAGFWEKEKKPGGGYKLPDTMFSSGPASNDEEELRRLFYVAITGRNSTCTFLYSRFRNDGKEMEPSMFIVEILDKHRLPLEKIVLDPEKLTAFTALGFGNAEAPRSKMEKNTSAVRLTNSWWTWRPWTITLKCRWNFISATLIRIPSPRMRIQIPDLPYTTPWKNCSVKCRTAAPTGSRPKKNLSTISTGTWKGTGKLHQRTICPAFGIWAHDPGRLLWPTPGGIQYDRFDRTEYQERADRRRSLKGKLDKLEFDGKSVTVVDYKTGDPDKAKQNYPPIGEKTPWAATSGARPYFTINYW